MTNDALRLLEFMNVLRRNVNDKVLDLDERMPNRFNFFIHRFEDMLRVTPNSFPPNRWSYIRIVFITQGSGEYITGIHKATVIKNTLGILPSRVIACSKNWTKDVKGFMILFNTDFFLQNNFPPHHLDNKKILSPSIRPFIHLTDEQATTVEFILESMIEERRVNDSDKNEMMALKTLELIILAERIYDETMDTENILPTTTLIKNFCDLVELNFMKEKAVTFYAAQLSVHPNYLNSLIKKYTGFTAKESLQNRLLLESKYLLHTTDLSIKEIANHIGFNDPNYFSSFFSRSENISPANYRLQFL